MNIKIEEKDISHHKITIAKDEIRIKISTRKLEEKEKVLKVTDYIINKIQYSGHTLRGRIDLEMDYVLLVSNNIGSRKEQELHYHSKIDIKEITTVTC